MTVIVVTTVAITTTGTDAATTARATHSKLFLFDFFFDIFSLCCDSSFVIARGVVREALLAEAMTVNLVK